MTKEMPAWGCLTVADALDLAPAIAGPRLDILCTSGSLDGGNTYGSHGLALEAEDVQYKMEFEAVTHSAFNPDYNENFITGFGEIKKVTFGYQDQDGGESVAIWAQLLSTRAFHYTKQDRLAVKFPWAKATIMPFVELRFLGELPNAKELASRYL